MRNAENSSLFTAASCRHQYSVTDGEQQTAHRRAGMDFFQCVPVGIHLPGVAGGKFAGAIDGIGLEIDDIHARHPARGIAMKMEPVDHAAEKRAVLDGGNPTEAPASDASASPPVRKKRDPNDLRVGKYAGRRQNWKKAVVSLKEGTDLDVFGTISTEAPPTEG